MTLTRYDAMFFAAGAATWFILGEVNFWETLGLATLYTLMFFAGELKESRRRDKARKVAA